MGPNRKEGEGRKGGALHTISLSKHLRLHLHVVEGFKNNLPNTDIFFSGVTKADEWNVLRFLKNYQKKKKSKPSDRADLRFVLPCFCGSGPLMPPGWRLPPLIRSLRTASSSTSGPRRTPIPPPRTHPFLRVPLFGHFCFSPGTAAVRSICPCECTCHGCPVKTLAMDLPAPSPRPVQTWAERRTRSAGEGRRHQSPLHRAGGLGP